MGNRNGRPKTIVYVISDPQTGEEVFRGFASDCAEFLGIPKDKFYRVAYKAMAGTYKPWDIRREGDFDIEEQTAIQKWDAFTAPLRRKYGIPVYKGD